MWEIDGEGWDGRSFLGVSFLCGTSHLFVDERWPFGYTSLLLDFSNIRFSAVLCNMNWFFSSLLQVAGPGPALRSSHDND